MAVEDDSDRLALLDDFGLDVHIKGRVVTGILDNEFSEVGGVASTVPVLWVRSIDIENDSRGDALTIGTTDYTIAEMQPDGQGITIVVLQET